MRSWSSLLVVLVAGCEMHRAPHVTGTVAAPALTEPSHEEPGPSSAPTAVAVEVPPPVPVRRPGAFANLDPTDDFVVGPPDVDTACEAELAQAGITWKQASLPVHVVPRSKIVCGAPQVVLYLRGPSGIVYNAAPVVTCTMALALVSFERILQEEARTLFSSSVARIDHVGTYSCREVAAYPGTVSEHSYANAIDITRFVLKNGRSVEVLRDFDRRPNTPPKPEGAFLRVVSRRANDEDVFSHVLTPFFDDAHRNHFHLDLARFRQDGTRPIDVVK